MSSTAFTRFVKQVTVGKTAKRAPGPTSGFHLSLTPADYKKLQLCPAFQQGIINMQLLATPPPGAAAAAKRHHESKALMHCTCRELETLNARFKEAMVGQCKFKPVETLVESV